MPEPFILWHLVISIAVAAITLKLFWDDMGRLIEMKCPNCKGHMTVEYDGKTIKIWRCLDCGHRLSRIPK